MAVLHFFREHGLKLPRLRWSADEPDEIIWAKPSYQAVRLLLTNPSYAGAYAYGQRGRDRDGGRSLGRSGPRHRHALDELEVLLPDHHPGYITWERYLANRAALRDNCWHVPTSRGAPRAGSGLLVGIVYCGRCGCRMRPTYSERSAAYACLSRRHLYGEPICQSLPTPHIDQAVSEAFLAVIRPAAIDAALALAAELERDQARVEHQWQLRLERAHYEAERARRQFDRVEPENRLVARELERRWNDALRAVAELETEYRRERERGLAPLSAEEQAHLRQLVTDVPALWHAVQTTAEDRKRLLRCLVREVILLRDEARPGAAGITTVRIGWRTGAWSTLLVRRPGAGECTRTAQPLIERIRALAQQHADDRIAELLNADGQCTRQGLPWTFARVKSVRRAHAIPSACPIMPRGDGPRGDGLVPAAVAAARLGVTPGAIQQWAHLGVLRAEQMAPGAPLWVRLTEEDVARLDGTRAAQGDGRWHVLEARRVLGLTDAELWQRLRAGDLVAYRVTTRRRWEWRISLATDARAALM
jgi:hypothetical protein